MMSLGVFLLAFQPWRAQGHSDALFLLASLRRVPVVCSLAEPQ